LERLSDLLFELSNEDRLGIMFRLREGPMRVTPLARELEITNQECSRHAARLSGAGLVEKDPEGFFDLTPFGRVSLRLLPGWIFVSEYNDYFNTHSLETLPPRLVSRIGELRGSVYTENVMVTFDVLETIVREAEEYVWLIHDQYLLNTLPLFKAGLERGIKMRTVEPRVRKPERILDPMRPEYIEEGDEEFFMHAWESGQVSTVLPDEIDAFLYLSEKEAVLAFPLREGGFDYVGFTSRDTGMLGFCRDLFEFYFETGEPLTMERGLRRLEERKKFHQERKARE